MSLEILKDKTDEEIREWLPTVEPTTLGIALLNLDDETQHRVFDNMSERASLVLRADMARYRRMNADGLVAVLAATLAEYFETDPE